jgi:superfamily II DNA helicase RecQ
MTGKTVITIAPLKALCEDQLRKVQEYSDARKLGFQTMHVQGKLSTEQRNQLESGAMHYGMSSSPNLCDTRACLCTIAYLSPESIDALLVRVLVTLAACSEILMMSEMTAARVAS